MLWLVSGVALAALMFFCFLLGMAWTRGAANRALEEFKTDYARFEAWRAIHADAPRLASLLPAEQLLEIARRVDATGDQGAREALCGVFMGRQAPARSSAGVPGSDGSRSVGSPRPALH